MFGGVMTARPGPLPFLMEAGDWVDEPMNLAEGWSQPINLVKGPMDLVRPRVLVRPGGRCCPYKSLLGGDGVSGMKMLVMPHGHVDGRCSHNRTTQPTNTNNKSEQHIDNNDQPTADNSDNPAADNNKKSEPVPANTTKMAPNRYINNKWQFSVDLHGCDHQVKAITDSGKIIVEGRRQNGDSQMMVRHVTTLPHHVNPATLTATVKDGLLTVSTAPVTVLPVTIFRSATQAEEHSHQQTVSEDPNHQHTTNEDPNQQHTGNEDMNCQQSATKDNNQQQTVTEDSNQQQTATEDTDQQTTTEDTESTAGKLRTPITNRQ